MYFKYYFLQCDFLGKTQNFTIAKKNTFRTYIGSILSLIIIAIMISFVTYFSISIFDKDNPNLVTTVYNVDDPPFTPINDSVHIMTLSLQTPNYSLYIDESIYTLNAFFIKYTISHNGTQEIRKEKLNIIKCNEYNFTLLPDYFDHLDLDNLYCLDKNSSLYIKGEYGKEEWAFINYEFSRCVNTSENNNICKSDQEIDDKLAGGFLGIFMTDLSIIPNQYNKPSVLYGKNVFTTFMNDRYTDVWFYMKIIKVNTDRGLLLKDIKHEEFIAYDSFMTTSDYRRSEVFLNLHFRLSQRTEIYDRTYQKIQAIAAELGGIIKISLIIGELLVYLFREVLYKDYILTFFSEDKNCNCSNKSGFIVYTSPNKKYIDSVCKNFSFSSINRLVSLNSKKEIKKEERHKVKLNSMVLLGPCLFDSKIRRNIALINSKFKRIEYLFDVIHFLKSKDEIRALKRIVFDDIQNKTLMQSYSFQLNASEDEKQFDFSIENIKKKNIVNK